MADLSLDDFIKKNNVKVRLNNSNRATQRRGKPGQTGQRVVSGPKNDKFKVKGQDFDARQKLVAKAGVSDARDKIIINKKSGRGDARNKIVSKQVQKGQFDARSLIQRHKKPPPGSGDMVHAGIPPNFALTRTLSNPNAKGRPHIQVTNNGLQVTRQVPNTQVSMKNNSIQVTKRSGPHGNAPQLQRLQTDKDFVPIIQIRNDRYKQPTISAPARSLGQFYQEQGASADVYPYDDPSQEYSAFSYQTPSPAFSGRKGYRDYDDPQNNAASVAVPEVPRVSVSNLRAVEEAGMRPVAYSSSPQQVMRAPPGAATLSQGVSRVPSGGASRPLHAGMKRKQPTASMAPPPAKEVSGPLRLGKGGGPGIDLRPTDTQGTLTVKKPKFSTEEALQEKVMDEDSDLISPLQGYRVVVTNLYSGVTQDDIIELFGAVGPLKKAKMLKAGSAEVVYISRKDAVSAVQKYHSRELDGQPMYVKMTTSQAAVVKKAVGDNDPDITGEALRLYKKGTGIGSLPEAPIEIPTIHRALFKAGPPGPNKSVKFTVKI